MGRGEGVEVDNYLDAAIYHEIVMESSKQGCQLICDTGSDVVSARCRPNIVMSKS